MYGTIIEVIKGDTRSLDYSSYSPVTKPPFPVQSKFSVAADSFYFLLSPIPIYLSLDPSIYPSIYLSLYLSINLYIALSIYLYIYIYMLESGIN